MNPKILIAGAAIVAMTAVSAQAASSSHKAGAYAEPSQPIAYSSLKAYMKASPSQRAKRDWSGGSAASASNAGANVSATTPAANAGGSMPMSTQTQTPDPNVADTPPTVSPDVSNAQTQPPLNQAPPTNAAPPASNAPVTTDTPGSAQPAPAPAPQ
jgi:hypothetical protein